MVGRQPAEVGVGHGAEADDGHAGRLERQLHHHQRPVAGGVGAHLEAWGVPTARIVDVVVAELGGDGSECFVVRHHDHVGDQLRLASGVHGVQREGARDPRPQVLRDAQPGLADVGILDRDQDDEARTFHQV